MKKKDKEKIVKGLVLVVIICIFTFLGYDIKEHTSQDIVKSNVSDEENRLSLKEVEKEQVTNAESPLKIHFVDVGQGDSIILEQNNHYMLIDAGTNACEKDLIKYIDQLSIKKFDYVIGTHAHEDHIGSMDAIIDHYEIDRLLFSKHTTTTKTFENFVTAVKRKKLKLYAPTVDEEFLFQDTKFVILAPTLTEYKDLNNYSIVLKVIYQDTSFLFTGDAENLSEEEMLKNGIDLSANVLKIGHHGSNSSTSQQFLKAVNPEYAVISCGKDNDYGHPKKAVMNRLKANGITVYRTDECGSIVLTSDGKQIIFDKEKGSYKGN